MHTYCYFERRMLTKFLTNELYIFIECLYIQLFGVNLKQIDLSEYRSDGMLMYGREYATPMMWVREA